ncbi:cupin domain-containing protein [Blastopirellula sp. J2-11]|uniref:cupin domain-containing protein n=1 Tax=Blastopirellula sp. J2-11 TaxID=2943192 RepID=UPI0021C62B2C|nr:cupin domain-containing protein [Blastopirellula sp. J2-11]UUO08093.1 cupin domain-containing protein [Blastopirellula sp. J2-11]
MARKIDPKESWAKAMQITDLLADLPKNLPQELVETLLQTDQLRIERIVSHAHASPPNFWYDQDEHEWVFLLTGAARLEIKGEANPVELNPGQAILLPAHQPHRVAWTTPKEPTVWLAVFYR